MSTFILAGGLVEAGPAIALVPLALAESPLEAGQTGAVEGGPEVGAEAAVPTRTRLTLVHLGFAPGHASRG
jgi:hypothetical protein